MSGTDLVFRVLGINEASKVCKEVTASSREMALAVRESDAEMAHSAEEAAVKRGEASAGGGLKSMSGAAPILLGVAAAAAAVGAKTVEMGQKFETGMVSLETGAGEAHKNIGMVSAGILQLAPELGTSTEKLTKGMFMIESAGFHGADGLNVLHAAAEGAKVGNAELSTTGNALTDVLNDYHRPASAAVAVTSQLVKTVSLGKTSMEEIGTSMSAVVPIASSAHIGFDQVAGAMATMTAHGMSAQQSAQDLAATITSLQAPNAVAVHEMQQLGLNSNKVSKDLGKQGLTGTLSELTGAITSHMGPAGLVIQSAFNSSSAAAANAKAEIATMPPQLQKLAQGYLKGDVSAKQWGAGLKGLDPINQHLMKQFALTAKETHSFNSLLTSGGPAAQTYNAALEKMTGGSTGLATSLLLTGENSQQFTDNVKAVGEAGKTTAAHVTGWSQVTNTLAFKLDAAKEVGESLGIKIGLVLMPPVKAMVGGFTEGAKVLETGVTWMTRHKAIAEALGIGIGVVLVPPLWAMASALVATAAGAIATAAPFLAVIAVVALLAYGFMQLAGHWHTVEHAFAIGFDFVKDHWKEFVAAFLPGVGFLIVGVTELVEHWKQVQHFLGDIWHDTEHAFEEVFVTPVMGSVHFLERGVTAGFGFFERLFTRDIPSWLTTGNHLFTAIFITPVMGEVHFLERGVTAGFGFFERLFTRDIPSWLTTGAHLFTAIFITPVVNAVHWLESGFQNSFAAIKGFMSAAFNDAIGIVRGPVDGIISLVDQAIGYLDGLHVSIPSWVPLIGGDSFGVNIPQIPMLAGGGLVMPQPGGVKVTVAEAGAPEIVTPIPAMQAAMTAALAAAGGRLGAANTAPGSSADNPLHAVLELRMGGELIDRILVQFQKNGGRLQSVAMAVG